MHCIGTRLTGEDLSSRAEALWTWFGGLFIKPPMLGVARVWFAVP